MNQYDPMPYETPQQMNKPKKGWFGRNWFWFLPLVILLPIFCCCGGGWWAISFGVGEIMSTPPYVDTLAEMEADSQVQRALGTPIKSPQGFGDLVSMEQGGGRMDVQINGSQTVFDARVPVSGPNGSGMINIVAQSSDGGATWTYTTRQLEMDGTGEIIDLLPAGSALPGEADDAALIRDMQDLLKEEPAR